MIEHTELVEDEGAPAIDVRRAVSPGQFVSYAGSDIARGEVVLRRGTRISSREIGMLAACGIAEVDVVRKPQVAVLSTGDELWRRAARSDRRGSMTATARSLPAAVVEAGGEPVPFGAFPDNETALELAMRTALEACDLVGPGRRVRRRVPANLSTASCRSSAIPEFWYMASRSSRVSRFASR